MSMGQYLNIMIAGYIHILNPSLFYKQIINNSKTIFMQIFAETQQMPALGMGKRSWDLEPR